MHMSEQEYDRGSEREGEQGWKNMKIIKIVYRLFTIKRETNAD